MEGNREKKLREQQLESYGRLMASFSHELKNHLGIIRESGGLIADFAEIHAAQLDPGLLARLEKATASIEKRVVTAARMFHHLSGFAHRSDTPCSSFDINLLCEEAAVLVERHARMKQMTIAVEPDAGLPALYSSPSLLHHVLFLVVTGCLDQLESGAALVLAPSCDNTNSIVVRFSAGSALVADGLVDDPALEVALAALDWQLAQKGGELLLRLSSL